MNCAKNLRSFVIPRIRNSEIPSWPLLAGFFTFLLGILPATQSLAQTIVNTNIIVNTTWADEIYHVRGTITLAPDTILQILPGTVVKFEDDAQLEIQGTLFIEGNEGSRVHLTSLADDNIAGDTGGDGPSVGRPGAWRGVRFEPGSDGSILSYCDIWFAGGGSDGLVSCYGASPTIRDCRLRAGTMGVRCENGATPSIERTIIDGCTNVPLAIDLASSPTLDSIVFGAEQDNGFDAIGLFGDLSREALIIPLLQVSIGSGDPVDISYLLMNTVMVDSFSTLEFEPGVVVKFMPGTAIVVVGRLVTQSNSQSRVVFTSLYDDQHGFPRDTQRNGNMTSPSAFDWEGIIASHGATLLLQDTDILYAGIGAVQLSGDGTNARVLGCKLAYSGSGLTARMGSIAVLTDSDIQGNTGAGIRYALGTGVSWSNLNVSGNGIAAIELLPGLIRTNYILAPRPIGSWSNPTYYLADETIDIAPDASLTISPGVTVKLGSGGAGFRVHGRLIASAPIENPIVFTSIHDDCPGFPQDTHSNGWITAPCPGDWGGIDFCRGDPGSVLDGCIIRFGGGNCIGAVQITGVDVDVRNCLFEYNMTAIGSEGDALSLVRDKRGLAITNVAFRDNILNFLTRIGGTLAEDGILENPGEISHLFLLDQDLIIPFDSHLDILPGVNIMAVNAGIDVFGSLTWSGELDRVSLISGPSGISGGQGGFGGFGGGSGEVGPGVPQIESCDLVFGCNIETLDPLDCRDSTKGQTDGIEWEGIRIHASSDDARTVLRDLVINGAEEPMWFEDSSPLIERVIFDGMAEPGIGILGRSAPRFNECIFRNGLGVPVRASLSADPQFVDPLFVSNGLHGLGLIPQSSSDVMSLEAAITKSSGLNCFIALGDLHVAPGQTLTIGPGVVVKFVENASLKVDGQLRVEGENDFGQQVALTSLSDDYWGGDSNCDGAATRAQDTTWKGIECSEVTVDAIPFLQGCIVANVHGNDSQGAIRVAGASSLNLTEVLFAGNSSHIIFVSGGGDPALGTISMSDFAGGPSVSSIGNPNRTYTVAAEDCWWGAESGPLDGSNDIGGGGFFNPEGEGCTVTDGVDYDPFSTDGSHVRLLGDASRDGLVNVFDASVVIRNVAGLWPLDAEAMLRADANCDGNVDALDASVLLGLAAGSLEWLDCQSVSPPLIPGVINLQFDSFDSSAQELRLRWDGPWQPRAVSLRMRPLQNGVRVLDVQLSGQSGHPAISAAGGASLEKSFAFASDEGLEPGSLLLAKLEIKAEVDLSKALVRVEGLWVDGSEEPNLDIRIDGNSSPQPPLTRPLSVKPNPFNPSTVIDFVVSGNPGQYVNVNLGIYDLSGRRVAMLANEELEPGAYQRLWAGLDDNGQKAPSGVYFLRFVQGGFVVNQKITLLK